MDDIRLKYYNPLITGTPNISSIAGLKQNTDTKVESDVSFEDLLAQKLGETGVNFSKHATKRVQERNIEVTGESLQRLNEGMRVAQEKDLKDALILVDRTAYIVNVPSNTVITTTESDDLKGSVFTNINGTVII